MGPISSVAYGDMKPRFKVEKKVKVPNPSEKYVTEKGKLDEALKVIVCEELQGVGKIGLPRLIWIDINTGEIDVTLDVPPKGAAGNGDDEMRFDGYDGKILLWTRIEHRSLGDLTSALVKRDEAPFNGVNFIEFYLREKFADKIEWN